MAEYIDRQAAIQEFDLCNARNPIWSPLRIRTLLSRIPTADVEPVRHGRWIEYPAAHYYKCSECRYTVPYRKAALMSGKRQYNYCPSCGAKMDGGV